MPLVVLQVRQLRLIAERNVQFAPVFFRLVSPIFLLQLLVPYMSRLLAYLFEIIKQGRELNQNRIRLYYNLLQHFNLLLNIDSLTARGPPTPPVLLRLRPHWLTTPRLRQLQCVQFGKWWLLLRLGVCVLSFGLVLGRVILNFDLLLLLNLLFFGRIVLSYLLGRILQIESVNPIQALN